MTINYIIVSETGRTAVRLVRNNVSSQSYSSGVVQTYLSNWMEICSDESFTQTEADVICHQLAYTGASSHVTTRQITTLANYHFTDFKHSCMYSHFVICL